MGKKRASRYAEVELVELIATALYGGDDAHLETAKERVRHLTALEQRQIRLTLGTLERMLDRAADEWQKIQEVWFADDRKTEASEQMTAKAGA